MPRKPYAATSFDVDRGQSKQELEARLVESVIKRLGLTAFKVISLDRPDAVVEFASAGLSYRIGCEVQTLHADATEGGSELRAFRSRWQKIIEKVVTRLESESIRPYCRVDFLRPTYQCLRGHSDETLVAEFVAAGRMVATLGELAFPVVDLPALSELLARIVVVDSDRGDLLWWPSHLQSGSVTDLVPAAQRAISDKSRLATDYDWRDMQEKWLLLAALGHGLSDVFGGAKQIPITVPADTIPFDVIIVWDKFSEDVWTAFPNHSVLCDGQQHTRNITGLSQPLQRFSNGIGSYPTKPKRT